MKKLLLFFTSISLTGMAPLSVVSCFDSSGGAAPDPDTHDQVLKMLSQTQDFIQTELDNQQRNTSTIILNSKRVKLSDEQDNDIIKNVFNTYSAQDLSQNSSSNQFIQPLLSSIIKYIQEKIILPMCNKYKQTYPVQYSSLFSKVGTDFIKFSLEKTNFMQENWAWNPESSEWNHIDFGIENYSDVVAKNNIKTWAYIHVSLGLQINYYEPGSQALRTSNVSDDLVFYYVNRKATVENLINQVSQQIQGFFDKEPLSVNEINYDETTNDIQSTDYNIAENKDERKNIIVKLEHKLSDLVSKYDTQKRTLKFNYPNKTDNSGRLPAADLHDISYDFSYSKNSKEVYTDSIWFRNLYNNYFTNNINSPIKDKTLKDNSKFISNLNEKATDIETKFESDKDSFDGLFDNSTFAYGNLEFGALSVNDLILSINPLKFTAYRQLPNSSNKLDRKTVLKQTMEYAGNLFGTVDLNKKDHFVPHLIAGHDYFVSSKDTNNNFDLLFNNKDYSKYTSNSNFTYNSVLDDFNKNLENQISKINEFKSKVYYSKISSSLLDYDRNQFNGNLADNIVNDNDFTPNRTMSDLLIRSDSQSNFFYYDFSGFKFWFQNDDSFNSSFNHFRIRNNMIDNIN